MPITEYYSEQEEKEFGSGTTLVVSDEVYCVDRRLAHALNHIYNHLRVLVGLSDFGPWSSLTHLEFLIANHPALRERAQALLDELSKPEKDDEKIGVLFAEILAHLAFETQQLVAATAILGGTISTEGGDKDDPEIQEEARIAAEMEMALARIPFIDYHPTVEEKPSIVRFKIL
jgi:hypothetical protein